jgi:hypothetical protein
VSPKEREKSKAIVYVFVKGFLEEEKRERVE